MGPPSWRQVLGGTLRKSCVIQNEFRLRTLLVQFKLHNRIGACVPIFFAPGLHDPLIGISSIWRPRITPPNMANGPPTSGSGAVSRPQGKTCQFVLGVLF